MRKKGVGVALGVVLLGASAVWLLARPASIPSGVPPLAWEACAPEQAEIMILGTFHFAYQDAIDIGAAARQREITALASALEAYAPTRVVVEAPYAENDALAAEYRGYLEQAEETPSSANEIQQIGFRVARRLGHDRVWGVDVPLDLWHDSIALFDEQYPGARSRLRRRWAVRHEGGPALDTGLSIAEILLAGNRVDPPPNSELYARFLPLVEGDVYAGALKLRPWYDRNLRIVQNFFRVMEGPDDRLLLVVGWGHVRALKQILDLTPQLCAVNPARYLTRTR